MAEKQTKATTKTQKPVAKNSKPATKSAPKTTSKPATKVQANKKPASKSGQKPPVTVKKSQVSDQQPTLQFSFEALPKNLFGLEEAHTQAIFDTVLSDRASRRFSTHKVKNRAEVSGTGKKPWRQKGTGRARAGSMRSPVFVGGGRAFGPTTIKNYSLKVNKKVRALALKSTLSQLAKAQQVFIYEFNLKKPSSKELSTQLKDLRLNELKNVLIVTSDLNVFLSARNMQNVKTLKVTSLSVESLLSADCMLISSADLKTLESLVK